MVNVFWVVARAGLVGTVGMLVVGGCGMGSAGNRPLPPNTGTLVPIPVLTTTPPVVVAMPPTTLAGTVPPTVVGLLDPWGNPVDLGKVVEVAPPPAAGPKLTTVPSSSVPARIGGGGVVTSPGVQPTTPPSPKPKPTTTVPTRHGGDGCKRKHCRPKNQEHRRKHG